jgi:hypothetical protein
VDVPPELLPRLLGAVRRFAAAAKRNLTDRDLQFLVDNLNNNHGLPDL